MNRNGKLLSISFRSYFVVTIFAAVATYFTVFIDGIVVSNLLGGNALAAVTLCAPIGSVFTAIIGLLGVGGSTVYSVLLGQRKNEEAKKIYSLSNTMMIVFSAVAAIGMLMLLPYIAQSLAQVKSLETLTIDYLRMFLISSPLMVFVMGNVYFMRSKGNPGFAMMIVAIANIVNLVMDFVYISVFDMGIAGASLATATGYLVGIIIMIIKRDKIGLPKIDFDIAEIKSQLGNVLISGSGSALLKLSVAFQLLFTNWLALSSSGDVGMIVFSLLSGMFTLMTLILTGSVDTMLPIASSLYGEQDHSGMSHIMRLTLKVSIGLTLSIFAMVVIFPQTLASIYGITEIKTYSLLIHSIPIFACAIPLRAFGYTMVLSRQVMKFHTFSIWLAFMRSIGFIVPTALLLNYLYGFDGLLVSFTVAEVLGIAMVLIHSAIINKRTNSTRSGLFLIPKTSENIVFDVTLTEGIEQAMTLSEEIITFLRENDIDKRTTLLSGLIAEEMAVNTINYNERKVMIDVIMRITAESVILIFRSNGKTFDPLYTDGVDEDSISHIQMVNIIASSTEFGRLCGLNSALIICERRHDFVRNALPITA